MTTGLRPWLNATDGWIIFLNTTEVIYSGTIIGQFVADRINAKSIFFVSYIFL